MAIRWTTLYKYVSLNYVEDILDNQRLFLSDGTNFNDPFEVTITDNNKSIKHIKGLHILSLTNSFQNKLMWSHYTDSHKGACLTIKIPNNLVYPICYTSKRVFFNSDINQILSSGKIISKRNIKKSYASLNKNKQIALIKDQKWIYEKEYRIVLDAKDESKLIFNDNKWFLPVKITNIYLGVNFGKNDLDLKKRIMKACSRNRIKIAKMVLSNYDYSLRVKR